MKSTEKKTKDKINNEKAKTSKIEIKSNAKKTVVKRRKLELKPTRASAVAIVSQANRAKKQALIEKIATSDVVMSHKSPSSDTKIPWWVWAFFGCSLFLFCISFYHAIIRPQMDDSPIESVSNNAGVFWVGTNTNGVSDDENNQLNIGIQENLEETSDIADKTVAEGGWEIKTPVNLISDFFNYLSNRDYDTAFSLLIPALQKSSEIRTHFTEFRMNPFLDWIDWWRITPENFVYIDSPSYWRDKYGFDLSYTLISTQDKYEESREFVVDTSLSNPKIVSIECKTHRCSYHPLFWPEKFWLMK